MTPVELEAALGAGPFRHRMGLGHVPDVAGWLRAHGDSAARAEARARVAASHPLRFAVDPGADEILLAGALEALEGLAGVHPEGTPSERLRAISGALGADVLLVERVGLRLVAVAVAYPSGWSPERALGRGTAALHAVVPDLDAELGASIARFLGGLAAGRAYARTNAGLAVGDSLDRHPEVSAPAATADTPLEALRLRLEDQCFVGLDASALLFLVSVRHVALGPLVDEPRTAPMLLRWLASMPDSLAAYKGLASVRPGLLARLERTFRATT